LDDPKAISRAVARVLDRNGSPARAQPAGATWQAWVDWSEAVNTQLEVLAAPNPVFAAINEIFEHQEQRIAALDGQIAQHDKFNERLIRAETAISILQAPKATLVDYYRNERGQVDQVNIFSGLEVAATSADDDRRALPHATAHETNEDIAELEKRVEARSVDGVDGK
jgi:coenzyme F420-reducing hydrogenase alpha subunit